MPRSWLVTDSSLCAVHDQFIKGEHLKTTKYLTDINDWTENNLMMLNQKKTKQIIFNFNRGKQFATEVELKKEPLEVVNEVKLLGVIISNDLKWHKNTNYLTKKANKKMRMLHLAAKFTKNRDHLKHIYQTFIRSNLEFSSTVWHCSLTSADTFEPPSPASMDEWSPSSLSAPRDQRASASSASGSRARRTSSP